MRCGYGTYTTHSEHRPLDSEYDTYVTRRLRKSVAACMHLTRYDNATALAGIIYVDAAASQFVALQQYTLENDKKSRKTKSETDETKLTSGN
jgi:hypothetical protein